MLERVPSSRPANVGLEVSVEFLNDTWCAEVVEAASGEVPGLGDLVLDVQVTGTPDGTRKLSFEFESGRLRRCGAAGGGDAAVSLKLPWATACAVADGTLDPSAAFMTGAIKTEGATGPLFALLALWRQDEVVNGLARAGFDDRFDRLSLRIAQSDER